MILRKVTVDDAPQLLHIYTHYIQHSTATFREAPQTPETYRKQVADLSAVYPFYVAEENGQIIGFANAEPFRVPSGYRYSVELTIYLHPEAPRQSGIGRKLYEAVLGDLAADGFVNAYACISNENEVSLAFHRAMGFEQIAVFPNCACKHGRWLSAVWMGKQLNPLALPPIEPVPFHK